MKFGFNSSEALQNLNDIIKKNVAMTDEFDKASKSVANAFTEAGDVVSGAVGAACANCWGDGSSDFFKKKLLAETERFIFDKVEKMIGVSNQLADATMNTYDSARRV